MVRGQKWQIRTPTKIWIETHHLKGIFLSFQKILKFLTMDQLYWSYGCWKMFNYPPPPPCSCHNLNSVDPKSKIIIVGFSESSEKYLSNGIIKVYIWEIKVFTNLARTMDYSPWSEAEKWQIRAPMKFWLETHHLKDIFLSFQKILKFLTLNQLYSSYGCWKMFNYNPPKM